MTDPPTRLQALPLGMLRNASAAAAARALTQEGFVRLAAYCGARPALGAGCAAAASLLAQPEHAGPLVRSALARYASRGLAEQRSWSLVHRTVRAALGRLSALSVFLWRSILYGAFVWARRALNRRKRRFPSRAVHCNAPGAPGHGAAEPELQRAAALVCMAPKVYAHL